MVQHKGGYDPQLYRIRLLDRPHRYQLHKCLTMQWTGLHPQRYHDSSRIHLSVSTLFDSSVAEGTDGD